MKDWPFAESPNARAFTTKALILERKPILFVYHNRDGAWQFHCDEDPRQDDAMVVCLHHLVDRDSHVSLLADLPRGWGASRLTEESPWTRFELDPAEDI